MSITYELLAQGIDLRAEGPSLAADIPEALLTADLEQSIRVHKDEILEALAPSTDPVLADPKLARWEKLWAVDFEFRSVRGERPVPVCFCAHELRSGRKIWRWRDAFGVEPPYDVGPDSLFIAFNAQAELTCHLALGWPFPHHILDLFAASRRRFNGAINAKAAEGLLAIQERCGLSGISEVEKRRMQKEVYGRLRWSREQAAQILRYCASDVDAAAALLPKILPDTDVDQALEDGRFMAAVARIADRGVPIDRATHDRLQRHRAVLQDNLVVDRDVYGLYDRPRMKKTPDVVRAPQFKTARFIDLLREWDIPGWPKTPTGMPQAKREVLSAMGETYPQVLAIRDLRDEVRNLQKLELPIGKDGRARADLGPFMTVTGRNQPKGRDSIFAKSRWLRGLIQPRPGYGIVSIDWSKQEVGVAAILSGDKALWEAYLSADIYLSLAIEAGEAPSDATKKTHGEVRDVFKALLLGQNYGQGVAGLAKKIRRHGEDLLDAERRATRLRRWLHRKFAVFTDWADNLERRARRAGRIEAKGGWSCNVTLREPDALTLRNYPMQASGAAMMRRAVVLAEEAGLNLISVIHDALVVEARLEDLEAEGARLRGVMGQASRELLDGAVIATDVTYYRSDEPPGRWLEAGAKAQWTKVMGWLEALEGAPAAAVQAPSKELPATRLFETMPLLL